MAIAAEKFGCRPSRLVHLADPVLALDFDLAAAARLLEVSRAASGAEATGTGESLDAARPAKEIAW